MKSVSLLFMISVFFFSSCSKKEEKKEPVMVKLYFFDEKYKSVEIDTNLIKNLEPVEVKSVD
jgi:hypothetical protein